MISPIDLLLKNTDNSHKLVHEMVHLLERNHNEAFKKYMDEFLPKWTSHRDLLNSAPLVHEDWLY